jgi:predicted nucleic acid-binding Zn finger protein
MSKEIRIISRKRNRIVVSSATDARRHYVVVIGSSLNNSKCSCPRWIYGVKTPSGRRRVPCKHILRVKGSGR